MVKTFKTAGLFAIPLAAVCFISCDYDFLGFFASTGLDERLKARGNLEFIDSHNYRQLTLSEKYSFIVVTDIHIKDGRTYGIEELKTVIDDPGNDVKFLVVLGDITQDGAREDLDLFINIAVDFGIPVFPAIGNHDIYFGGWTAWKDLIGSTNYRIDAGSTTLLIMDSANSFFGSDQLDWLETELRDAADRVFVFTHVNLFTKSAGDPQQLTDINERAKIVSILRNKCDAMFMGHVHEWIVNDIGGVKYVNVDAFHAVYQTRKSYCLVSVGADGVKYDFKHL